MKAMIITGIVITIALVALGNYAKAHDWYSPYCCSGKDCAPAKVHINRDGTITARNKFGIARFNQSQIKPSQDGQFHACIHPTLGPRCLYVPGGV